MINTSQEFTEIIKRGEREFTLTFIVNDTTSISSSDLLQHLEIIYEGMNNNKLGIGQFCKSSCSFKVAKSVDIDWKDSYFNISIQVNGANDIIPLGKFWVNSIKYNSSDDTYSIIAYDVSSVVSKHPDLDSYIVSDVLDDFENESGMLLTNKELLTWQAINEPKENETWQDIIGYIAGYDGYNIRTDREGNLELYKFVGDDSFFIKVSQTTITGNHLVGEFIEDLPESDNSIIDKENIFQNGLDTNDLVIISSFTIDNGEAKLVRGEGYGVSCYNPYINSSDNILDYMGRTYTPMDVFFRGNPAIEIGDIVYVIDNKGNKYTCYVMKSILTFDGGLSGKLYSFATDTIEEVIPVTPTEKKIEKVKDAVDDLVNGLMNGSGYFSYIDQNGKVLSTADLKKGEIPVGWQITDSETITETTKGWRFILGGLNHSSDGFRTYDTFALDAAGNINASAIKTGVLRAIDIIGSTIQFGNDSTDYHVLAKGVKWFSEDGTVQYGGIRFYGNGDFGVETNSIGMDAISENQSGVQFTNKGKAISFYNKDSNGQVNNFFTLDNKNGNASIYTQHGYITITDDMILLTKKDDNNESDLRIYMSDSTGISLFNGTNVLRLDNNGKLTINVQSLDIFINGSGYTDLGFVNDGNGHAVIGK